MSQLDRKLGLTKNGCLFEMDRELCRQVAEQDQQTQKKVKIFTEFACQAGRWNTTHREYKE